MASDMGDSLGERLRAVMVIVEYELRRATGKKALLLGIALALLPFAIAIIVKHYTHSQHLGSTRLLWAAMAGLDPVAAFNAILSPASTINAVSFWWLIIVLFAGDLLASDARDGALRLLLSKPLTRGEYLAGKLVGVLVLLTVISLMGMGGVVGSAYILGGSQEHVSLAPAAALLLVVGGLPLLLLTALVGLKTKSPLSGFISGIVLYFVFQMIVSLLGIYLAITGHASGIIEGGYRASSLIPLSGGKSLATLYYLAHAYGATISVPGLGGAEIEIGNRAIAYGGTIEAAALFHQEILAVAAWSAVFLALTYAVLRRMDL